VCVCAKPLSLTKVLLPPFPTRQHSTLCKMLLPAATYHRNTLQLSVPLCNTLCQLTAQCHFFPILLFLLFFAIVSTDGAYCSVLQYAATRCSMLHASPLLACELMVLQVTIHIHTLLHTATHRNPPQRTLTRRATWPLATTCRYLTRHPTTRYPTFFFPLSSSAIGAILPFKIDESCQA